MSARARENPYAVSAGLQRNWRWWMAATATVAAAARVAVLVATAGYRPRVDDASYARVARALITLGRYPQVHAAHVGWIASAYRPPGWPFTLAGLWSLTGFDVQAARLLLAALGVAVVLVGAHLARRVAGPIAGVVAGALLALDPLLLATGTTLESETLDTALVLGALLCALRARERRALRPALAAGLLAGAAALTRTNDLVLIPLVAWLATPTPVRPQWRRATAVLAAGVLVVAPWTVRNAIDLHHFIPVSTETGNTLAGTYNVASLHHDARWLPPAKVGAYPDIFSRYRLDGPVLDEHLTNAAIRWIGHHPGYLVETLGWNTARLLGFDGPSWAAMSLRTMSLRGNLGTAVWLASLLITLLAAIDLARRRRRAGALAVVALVLLLPAALVNGEMRLAVPLQALLCVFAASAIAYAYGAKKGVET